MSPSAKDPMGVPPTVMLLTSTRLGSSWISGSPSYSAYFDLANLVLPRWRPLRVPKLAANRRWASVLRSWSRKTRTRYSHQAALISATVSRLNVPRRSIPVISAPSAASIGSILRPVFVATVFPPRSRFPARVSRRRRPANLYAQPRQFGENCCWILDIEDAFALAYGVPRIRGRVPCCKRFWRSPSC